jgi:tRNA (guanine37-N1)-methyltransferase
MKVGIVTLFPELFDVFLQVGVVGRAVGRGVVKTQIFNPRHFTQDAHRTVDDRPFGGGPGMVMMPMPLLDSIAFAKAWMKTENVDHPKVVYLSPAGQKLTQAKAKTWASEEQGILFLAGRYEGIDERVMTQVDEVISIGDYILSGGEIPVQVCIETMVRLLPGVLNDPMSAEQDAFSNPDGILDCPHYTRPQMLEHDSLAEPLGVPDVLLGGNHETIRRWRRKQALGQTWKKRPDLLENKVLDKEAKRLLEDFEQEFNNHKG